MAQICFYCEKKRMVGHNVSHSNNKTKRRFCANIQKVRAIVNRAVSHVNACTRCIRSGVVQKAA